MFSSVDFEKLINEEKNKELKSKNDIIKYLTTQLNKTLNELNYIDKLNENLQNENNYLKKLNEDLFRDLELRKNIY